MMQEAGNTRNHPTEITAEGTNVKNNLDNSESSLTEKALQESEKFSYSLLDNSPNPILLYDLDASVKYVNRAFEQLTGFSAKEITGIKGPFPWWSEERQEEYRKGVILSAYNDYFRVERLLKKKNGKRFWVEIISVPILRNGQVLFRLSNWTDITERKKAEEALKESESSLRESERFSYSLLDNAPNSI
jgi:two-component system sensor histidine kinase DctS